MSWSASFFTLKACVEFSIFYPASFLMKSTFLYKTTTKKHRLFDFKTS